MCYWALLGRQARCSSSSNMKELLHNNVFNELFKNIFFNTISIKHKKRIERKLTQQVYA